MSTSRFKQVNELLDYFDEYQDEVDSKKSVIKNFLNRLKAKFDKRKNFIIKGSKFYKVGSSYEDTVVSPKADFDIAMVLAFPFTMDSFECVEVDIEGFYKLRCTDDSEYLDQFLNSKNYLKVEELRDKIFNELTTIIENLAFDGFSIKLRTMGSSVSVLLKDSTDSFKMDIVPQIAANVFDNNIPGWYEDDIPDLIREFIDSKNVHILFNLSCPPDFQHENYSHLVVQPSFNLIEKYCMLNSEIVSDSVLIAKSVCKKHNWSKDGLRSFHIKQVALDLLDEIEATGDPWDGYKMIMKSLITMLEDGVIDGCFIEDHNIMSKEKKDCLELGVKVKGVVKKIHPNNILQRLGFD